MTIDAKIRITAIVDQAVKALQQVKKEATAVEQAGGPGKPALTGVTTGAETATKKVRETKKAVDDLNASTAAAGDKKVFDGVATGAAAVGAASTKAQAGAKKVADETTKGIRQTRNEMRLLGPQLTDIAVSLSTGQSPFYVLLQQGGQIRDIFGSFGAAGRALLSVFTPVRLALGGVAAAIGLVAFEAIQGNRESAALNKTLALTGNIAGESAGQLNTMALNIAREQKAAIGNVRENLAGLVATGQFTGTSLEAAGRAATSLQKLTGQTTEETLKQFDGMGDGVAAWAAKSNRAYNFLTAEQYTYIRSLEAQGRTQEAMKVTLEALNGTIEQRSVPAVGTLERAWSGVGRWLSSVIDDLKSIGRDTTPEDRLAKLRDKVADLLKMQEEVNANPGVRFKVAPGALEEAQRQLQAEEEAHNRSLVMASDRAIAAQNEQDRIKRASKSYQDALAQVDAAGAQKLLAQQLAFLDRRQAEVNRANANGLTSEAQHSAELNKIDQQRLQAQATTIQRQIELARARVVEKPEDQFANDAQVKQLQGQLAQVQGQIAAAATKAKSDAEGFALNDARENAQAWSQIWEQALQRVRDFTNQNAASSAERIAGPTQRAAVEAAAAVETVQRQVDELQRDLAMRLSITTDPGQRAELQRQIQDLATQAAAAIGETTRKTAFESLQRQFSELDRALQLEEERLADAVEQGKLTTVQAEQEKFAARARSLPQLENILRLMQAQAATPDERNRVEGLVQDLGRLRNAATELETTFRSTAKSGLTGLLNDIGTGAKTVKDALLDMVGSFAKSMLNVLNQRLAEQWVNQGLDALKKMSASGGSSGGGGWLGSAVRFVAGLFHGGGVVGAGSGSGTRSVSPAAWAFAPRYHTEGIVGLKPRERAIIALDGEEVLTEDNPRHIKNARTVGGVTVSNHVTISGASGDAGRLGAAANELTDMFNAAINQWATRESRVGGILASGGAR